MPPPPTAFADALILTGPTGSGKSTIALELAERYECEIVSMDSMTLYRGMDIGTAKPTPGEQGRVPHHMIDILDPWEAGNVAWWLDRAAEACTAIRSRGHRPLLVGGTPFYLKAVLCGLFDAPPTDVAVRARLEAEAEHHGPSALFARLTAVDPIAAGRLHPNDVRRVIRALEVWELTGRPISSFQQTWDTAQFSATSAQPSNSIRPIPIAVLDWPREELYCRIDSRVDMMLAAGWLDEVRRLLSNPRPMSKEASQALGYPELASHLAGTGPGWTDTVTRIKVRTRQFAKRQLTWFRGMPDVVFVPAKESGAADRVAETWANGRSPTSSE